MFTEASKPNPVLVPIMALIVQLPVSLTHYLPGFWHGQVPVTNIANTTSTFVGSTNATDPEVAELLAHAAQAPFISYSDEFTQLVGLQPNITLVKDQKGDLFAFEAGPWIPERKEFWFTSAIYDPPGYLSVLDLDTLTVKRPNITRGWKNFQRGIYSRHISSVVFTSYRDNGTYAGALVTIDPETHNVTPILNSFNGLPFSGFNDITQLHIQKENRTLFFFSDNAFTQQAYPTGLQPSQMFTGLYRWDDKDQTLLPVLSQATLPGINAVKLTPDLKTLYVGASGSGGPELPFQATLWKYDLDEEYLPVNPRLFAVPRFFLDGFQVDDCGRVWSIEGDGIVVRSAGGRLLGVVNKLYFGRDIQFANLGLAGDLLIVLAVDRLWVVKLSKTVVGESSKHVFG